MLLPSAVHRRKYAEKKMNENVKSSVIVSYPNTFLKDKQNGQNVIAYKYKPFFRLPSIKNVIALPSLNAQLWPSFSKRSRRFPWVPNKPAQCGRSQLQFIYLHFRFCEFGCVCGRVNEHTTYAVKIHQIHLVISVTVFSVSLVTVHLQRIKMNCALYWFTSSQIPLPRITMDYGTSVNIH